MAKALPRDLTSYDCLKAAAVVVMIADHIGYYFYPHDLWWRAVGRTGFPIWFFLVGHARSRNIPWRLWGGALFLTVMNVVSGMAIFPMNALVTIILIRLLMDPVTALIGRSRVWLPALGLCLTLLILPSAILCDYGSQGLMLALFGYAVRRRFDAPEDAAAKKTAASLFVLSLATFICFQQIEFAFQTGPFLLMAAGSTVTMLLLYGFQPAVYAEASRRMPHAFRSAIQIMGRYTLEIYVAHLTLFKLIGLYAEPSRFQAFQWSWLR